MTREQLQQKIVELSPWFYSFDLGDGVRTTSAIPEEVTGIFETRLQMVNKVIDTHFAPERLHEISCIDVGCHEGFYSMAMAKKGVGRVLGVDVRENSLRKAQFVAETLGLRNVSFDERNCEQLRPDDVGGHELTLFLGLLYHLENPMLCLRNVSAITKELCIVETQVIDEVTGSTEWGAQAWTRPYQGVLAVIDESGEYYADNAETGSTPLATCPSPKALITMLRHAGFRRVEMIRPPAGAYEQHARGKRVICAAYK